MTESDSMLSGRHDDKSSGVVPVRRSSWRRNRVQRSVHSSAANAPAPSMANRVLVIPGLDGDPTMVQAAGPWVFRGMRVLPSITVWTRWMVASRVWQTAPWPFSIVTRPPTHLPSCAANRLAEQPRSRLRVATLRAFGA